MLRDIFYIAAKDVRYMLRTRETLMWVFLMPIVFFYFIGTITGGFASSGDAKDKLAVMTGENPGFLADELLRRLEQQEYAIVRADSLAQFNTYSRRLSIPTNFTDSVLAVTPVKLSFDYDKEGLRGDYDGIRTRRAIYTTLADLIVLAETGQVPSPEGFRALASMPRSLALEVRPAGRRKVVPTGFEQAIPGIMVMFTLLVMTTSGAILLVIERRQGLLRRLASTPIDRRSVVLGKTAGKLTLGIVQIAFAMATGTVLFKMNWGENIHAVVLLMLVYAAFMATVGLVLGSLSRTEGQAVAIGVIASNVMAALGGCWWPIEITPQWMQRLQLFLPTGWAMDGLHRLVSFGSPPSEVLPHVLGMFAGTVVLALVATRVFRYD